MLCFLHHLRGIEPNSRLCPVRFTSVRVNMDLSKVKITTATGDFTPSSLAHVVNHDEMNKIVVKAWLDRACKLSFSVQRH